MKTFLFPLLLIISSACFSQSKQYLYYFDKDLNSTPKEKAILDGVGTNTANLFEIKIYNASNKNLLWSQHFMDSSLQLSEGLYQSYYANGSVESAGNYSKGYEDGLWQKWDSAGHDIDSSFYVKGMLARYIHRGYYKSGFPDSIIISDMKTNELAKTFYIDSGLIANQVFFTGEKGLRKFYTKGVFSGTDSVYSREEIEASFPNGGAAWTKYIVSGLQKYADEIYKDNAFGSCIVKFIVNKEGKVTEVEATNMKGTALARVAVRIIKNSPKWIPASQYGLRVNGYRLQPVTILAPN
ncbi:MAG TPA: energy transducer TonB [Hanamia sp.]